MSRIDDRFDDHFDEMACLLYLDGQLESDLARVLVTHTEACPECRHLLDSLKRETHLLHESLVEQDEAISERLLSSNRGENLSWGWIGGLGVAAAGLYGLWSAVAEPWLDQLRQVGLGQDNLLAMLFFGGVFWKGWGDMLNLIEALSFVSVGVLVILLLRRNLRRMVSFSVVLGALFLAGLALPRGASATEFHRSSTESYTFPAGAVAHTDLVVSGPSVRIDGTVEGDLVVSGRTVTISGHVTGDVIAWAQDIRINGTVDGSCICGAQTIQINGEVRGSGRLFGQVVLIEGSVDKNLMAWSQMVEIASKGKVGGSVLGFAGTIISDGRIERDLTALFGKIDLNGYIGGNATLSSGYVMIGPLAEILGSSSYQGEHRPEVSSQAKLASPLSIEMKSRWEKYLHPRYYWWQLVRLAAAFALGLVFLLMAPDFFLRSVQKSNRIGVALGFGAVALVATPILAVIACITLVGIPVGIASLMLYLVTLYSAQIVVGAWLGDKLLGPATGRGARIARLALGLALLRVCFVVPVVNTLVVVAMLLLGLGSVVLTMHERIQSSMVRAASTPA